MAGIYTIMLMKPFLVSLLILYGTYIAAYKAKLFQNAAARYVVATLSSVFLFGGVVYLWILSSLSLAVPYIADVVGRTPGVLYLYRAVGGVLALAIAVYAFRTTVKPESTEEQGHCHTALSRSSYIRYTIATLSSLFHFAGVMYLVYGYTPLAFPQLRQTNRWGLFAVAGLLALVAAAYSFRVTVMRPRKSREPEMRPDD